MKTTNLSYQVRDSPDSRRFMYGSNQMDYLNKYYKGRTIKEAIYGLDVANGYSESRKLYNDLRRLLKCLREQ